MGTFVKTFSSALPNLYLINEVVPHIFRFLLFLLFYGEHCFAVFMFSICLKGLLRKPFFKFSCYSCSQVLLFKLQSVLNVIFKVLLDFSKVEKLKISVFLKQFNLPFFDKVEIAIWVKLFSDHILLLIEFYSGKLAK